MYGEVVIGVNMLFNYAVLSFANKVGNVGSAFQRLLLASFVGAIPVTIFPHSSIAVIIAFFGMTFCAFGKVFEPWKKSATMVLVGSLFAGGMLTAFQYRIHAFSGWLTVLTYAVIAYASLYFMKKKWLDVRTSRHVTELSAASKLYIWEVSIIIDVFVDSGNGCTEPLSGNPVHFVSLAVMKDSIPEDIKQPLLSWDPSVSTSLKDFPAKYQKDIRLIRLKTVQGFSWAIGFRFDKWLIEEGIALHPGYIVFTQSDRSYPNGAGAILHLSALESLNQERGIVYAS